MRCRSLSLRPVLLWCTTSSVFACREPAAAQELEPAPVRAACDPDGNLVPKAPSAGPNCYYNREEPGDARHLYRCWFRGTTPPCGGPIPLKPYRCECDVPFSRSEAANYRVLDIADAADCHEALQSACPGARCEGPSGACVPRPEGFRCTCTSPAPAEQGFSEQPLLVSKQDAQDNCDDALRLACGS